MQLFQMLDAYPWATATGLLAMVLVAIFFVSGADAASIVMGTLSERGSIDPSRWVVIFWGCVMGAVAAIMLLAGGEDALSGLQNITILVSAPFVIVMIMLCFALGKDLRRDPMMLRDIKGRRVIEHAVDYATERHGDDFYIQVQPFTRAEQDALERAMAGRRSGDTGVGGGPGTGPGYRMTVPGDPDQESTPSPDAAPGATRGSESADRSSNDRG
ncbi:BCCT family transporter [Pseudonocardia parietis]|uniref:Choline-glycine betaine transporter n=1 Tax=Pseudonocardia parietis TaxID=570936 RepID=A0ABS4VXH1_9PSEU|nr:choline-glycine betaine transporter [Pseudonocardia parietis]